MAKSEFLSPVVPPMVTKGTLAARPETLNGKTVGFLWNHRQGGERMLALIEERLKEKYQLKGTVHRTKHYIGEVVSRETLQDIAATCDVVVTAIGD